MRERTSVFEHVRANGTVDPTWNPAPDDRVSVIAVSGSTVYVGGDFEHIGGKARDRLAALDVTTGAATEWDPNPDRGGVTAITVADSTVYVGGSFERIGGADRHGLAAVDAQTGHVTGWNPNPDGYSVDAIAVSRSTVYVGGDFDRVGGKARAGLAALDASTGEATDWNPSPENPEQGYFSVYAIAASDSTVYVGGDFDRVGGKARVGLAALDASTGTATDWNPNLADPEEDYLSPSVYTIVISGPTVYVGGDFTRVGDRQRLRVAAIDRDSGIATAWDLGLNGPGRSSLLSLLVIRCGRRRWVPVLTGVLRTATAGKTRSSIGRGWRRMSRGRRCWRRRRSAVPSMVWSDRCFSAGRQVGTVTQYSDRLLILLLKARRPSVYREQRAVAEEGRPASAYDLGRLSDSELETLESLLAKAERDA